MKKNTIKRALATAAALLLGLTAGGGTTLTVKADDANTKTVTYSESDPSKQGNGSITIINAQKGETYKVFKVFDATVSSDGNTISYHADSIPDGLQNYFEVDNAGNVTAKNDAANGTISDTSVSDNGAPQASSYLVSALNTWSSDSTALIDGKIEANGTETQLKFDKLPYGYYYITSTTGSVVTVTSTKKDATVKDKNDLPTVDKNITGVTSGSILTTGDETDTLKHNKAAIAEVGSTVTYTATITPKSGGKNYVYHDKMDNGLKFGGTVTVKVGDTEVTAGTEASNTTYYLSTNPTDSDTFDVVFADTYIQSLASDSTITITYTATVTSDALQGTSANNGAYLTYGDNGKTEQVNTHVYNAKVTVNKNFQNSGTTNLESGKYLVAGFVLKNADGKYYKYTSADANTGTNASVTWVDLPSGTSLEDEAKKESPAMTVAKTTTDNNVLNFTGLKNGTYTLVEVIVPDGYNKAADQDVTIKDANQSNAFSSTAVTDDNTTPNLIKTIDVRNLKGSLLPSTGGIGTTIFYVAGIALIIGAAVVLINRKHKQDA